VERERYNKLVASVVGGAIGLIVLAGARFGLNIGIEEQLALAALLTPAITSVLVYAFPANR